MAGDWIPIRKELHRVREVLFIHQRTGRSVPDVVFSLMRMWSWFDSEAVEGFIPGLTSEICPELFGQTSEFWRAVVDSGWLLVQENEGQIGLQIPNSDHWLGETAKKRLLDAKRKRRERASEKCPKNVRKKTDKNRTTEQNRTVKKRKDMRLKDPVVDTPKEITVKKGGASASTRKTPRDRDLLFESLAEVCRIDWKLCTDSQRGELNQTVGILRSEDHTPEEVRLFGDWWYRVYWKGQKGEAPTPTQVRRHWQEAVKARSTVMMSSKEARTEASIEQWFDMRNKEGGND